MTDTQVPQASAPSAARAAVFKGDGPAAVAGVATAASAQAGRRSALADLREIAHDLVGSRDLLMQLTLRDIRVRYKQAVFGFAWALLIPMTIVLAGLAVRFAISYATGRPLDGSQFAAITSKSLPWAFFVGCIGSATPSLSSNSALVTKIYFPREVLPLAVVLAQTFDCAIGALVIALLLPVFGVGVSIQLLWVPVLLLLLWIFTVAVSLFLSCANLFFRDVKYMVQVFLSFGIFFTPVLFDASMFGPKGAPIIMLNPIAPLLEGLRLSIVEQHNLLVPVLAPAGFVVWHPWYLAYSALWAVGGLIAAALIFHRAEFRFAEMA
jgi:lipopolysaccharide transport system permease protein